MSYLKLSTRLQVVGSAHLWTERQHSASHCRQRSAVRCLGIGQQGGHVQRPLDMPAIAEGKETGVLQMYSACRAGMCWGGCLRQDLATPCAGVCSSSNSSSHPQPAWAAGESELHIYACQATKVKLSSCYCVYIMVPVRAGKMFVVPANTAAAAATTGQALAWLSMSLMQLLLSHLLQVFLPCHTAPAGDVVWCARAYCTHVCNLSDVSVGTCCRASCRASCTEAVCQHPGQGYVSVLRCLGGTRVVLPFAVHCPSDVSRGSPGVEWGRFPLVVSTVFYCAYFALGNDSAPPALVPHVAKVYRFVDNMWSSLALCARARCTPRLRPV